jgi:hypothetical protein
LDNCLDTFNEQLQICLQRFSHLASQGVETNLYQIISSWTLDVICRKTVVGIFQTLACL